MNKYGDNSKNTIKILFIKKWTKRKLEEKKNE